MGIGSVSGKRIGPDPQGVGPDRRITLPVAVPPAARSPAQRLSLCPPRRARATARAASRRAIGTRNGEQET